MVAGRLSEPGAPLSSIVGGGARDAADIRAAIGARSCLGGRPEREYG